MDVALGWGVLGHLVVVGGMVVACVAAACGFLALVGVRAASFVAGERWEGWVGREGQLLGVERLPDGLAWFLVRLVEGCIAFQGGVGG